MFNEETDGPYSPVMISELVESDAGKTETLAEIAKKEIFIKTVKPIIDSNSTLKEIWEVMQVLEENPKSAATHACGIVVSSRPLDFDVPVMRSVSKTERDENDKPVVEYVTQYDMEDIDKCGLIKIDALGLTTLDLIKECIRMIKVRHGVDIDLNKIPLNDGAVFDFLTNTNAYEGLFQMSNSGYVKMIRQMRPDCIEDIMAGMALN